MSLLTSAGNPDRDAVACDTSHQINASEAAALSSAGYEYIGRYLTGTAGTGDDEVDKNLTTSEISLLTDAGLKIFPIYQDGASDSEDYFTESKGSSDGRKAGLAAMELGFPDDTIIYFAVDVDIQDGDIAGTVAQYFTGVASGISGFDFKIGIYATRNVANTIITDGLAEKAFVSDMSTGFSGNLGFPMPTEWAFDQFSEVAFDDFYIDKVASNSTRSTAVDDFTAGGAVGGASDLETINGIIQDLGDTNTYFSFVKSVEIEGFSEEYTVTTSAADFTLKVDLEGSISDDDGDVAVSYDVSDGTTNFTLSSAVEELLTENESAIGASDMTNAMNEIAGVIKNGDITSDTSISADAMNITLKIKSTFDHEASNGKTYSLEYEITLKIHFHDFVDPLPDGVTETEATDYNSNLETVRENPEEANSYINNSFSELQLTPIVAADLGVLSGILIILLKIVASALLAGL